MRIIPSFTCLIFASLFFVSAFAADKPPPLDRILFQVTAEQWVETKSAVVNVSIDATLGKEDLTKARSTILNKLNKISDKGDWHITRFNRSQDSSGLERLSVSAEARLPGSTLATLRAQAKSVSKPGETYSITNINFTPSLAEYETIRASVRKNLYKKINDELARVNQTYPTQKFKVHGVNLIKGVPPLARTDRNRPMALLSVAAVAAPITVSNKVTMTATVVLGS